MSIYTWLAILLVWVAAGSAAKVASEGNAGRASGAAAELGGDRHVRPDRLRECYNEALDNFLCTARTSRLMSENLEEAMGLLGNLFQTLPEGVSPCDQDGQQFLPSPPQPPKTTAESVAGALEEVLRASEDILKFLYAHALECVVVLSEEDPDRFGLLGVLPFTDTATFLDAEAGRWNWRHGGSNRDGGAALARIGQLRGQLQGLEGRIKALFENRFVTIHAVHVPRWLEVELAGVLWDCWRFLRDAWGANGLEMLIFQAVGSEGGALAAVQGPGSAGQRGQDGQSHELRGGMSRGVAGLTGLLQLYATALIDASRQVSALSESVTGLLGSLEDEQGLERSSYLGLESLILHAVMLDHECRGLFAAHRRGGRLWEDDEDAVGEVAVPQEDAAELVMLIRSRVLWLQTAAQQQLRNGSFARFGLQVRLVSTSPPVGPRTLIRALNNLLEVIQDSHQIDFAQLYHDTEEWPAGPIRNLAMLMRLVQTARDGLESLSPLASTFLFSHLIGAAAADGEELPLPEWLARRLLNKLLSMTQALAHLLEHFMH